VNRRQKEGRTKIGGQGGSVPPQPTQGKSGGYRKTTKSQAYNLRRNQRTPVKDNSSPMAPDRSLRLWRKHYDSARPAVQPYAVNVRGGDRTMATGPKKTTPENYPRATMVRKTCSTDTSPNVTAPESSKKKKQDRTKSPCTRTSPPTLR